jgi:hypothetical protein
MIRTREARHISVAIDCSLQQAYDFLSVPGNFPKWASGLAGSLAQIDGEWVAATIHGPMTVRFSDRNAFGVLDHWVYPRDGDEIYVPLRVVANDSGCELTLTLFRLPGMLEEQYSADAQVVLRDLHAAKTLLERSQVSGR